jgi:hypothetical protein
MQDLRGIFDTCESAMWPSKTDKHTALVLKLKAIESYIGT